MEFENVGHHDEIDAVGGKGQFMQIAKHVDLARFSGNLAQRDPVLREQVVLRQAKLERVIAENINDERLDFGLFPGHDVASLRCV